MLTLNRQWHRLATRRLGGQLCRGFAMAGSYGLYLQALRAMPIADATALMFASPFIVAALSPLVLGERVPALRWAAIAAGFVGVLIVVQPGGASFRPEGLWALAGAGGMALSALLARRLGATEPPGVTAFYTAVAFLALGAVPTLGLGQWQAPDGLQLVLMALAGLIAGTAHFLIVLAYRGASASLVAPFEYSALLVAIVSGFVFFGDVPDAEVWAGIVVIVAAGVVLARRA